MSFQTKKIVLAVTISAFALSACEDAGNKTATGAAAGAAVGLISGILTSDDSNGKIKRTLAGAAIGGGIGLALDKQEADLRRDLDGSGALITNTGSSLIVTLPEAITFETNSTFVRGDLQSSLRTLAQNLREYPGSGVDVIGHTDNVGDSNFNQDLSSRRAQAVTDILVGSGIDRGRVRSYGRGETSPIASNDSSSGRAQNRRVEVVITPAS